MIALAEVIFNVVWLADIVNADNGLQQTPNHQLFLSRVHFSEIRYHCAGLLITSVDFYSTFSKSISFGSIDSHFVSSTRIFARQGQLWIVLDTDSQCVNNSTQCVGWIIAQIILFDSIRFICSWILYYYLNFLPDVFRSVFPLQHFVFSPFTCLFLLLFQRVFAYLAHHLGFNPSDPLFKFYFRLFYPGFWSNDWISIIWNSTVSFVLQKDRMI